jgi:hypothetical protein
MPCTLACLHPVTPVHQVTAHTSSFRELSCNCPVHYFFSWLYSISSH